MVSTLDLQHSFSFEDIKNVNYIVYEYIAM